MSNLNINFIISFQKKLKYLKGKFNNILCSPYAKLLKNNEHLISAKIKKIVYTKQQQEIQISNCGIVYDTTGYIIGVWNEKTQQPSLYDNTEGHIKVKKFRFGNYEYLLSKIGIIYNVKTHVPLGKFDKTNNTIIFEDLNEDLNEDNNHTDNLKLNNNNTISKCKSRNDTTENRVNAELRKKITKPLEDPNYKWVRPRNYAELYLPPRTILTKTYKGTMFLVEWTGTYFKSYSQGKEIRYKSLSNACDEFLKTQGVVNKKTTYDVWRHFKTLEGHSIDRLDLQPIS